MSLRPLRMAVIASLFAAWSSDAHASPQDVIGYGARSAALAGSGVASGEGFESVYSNPSLLVFARHPELDIGVVGATFYLEANGPFGTDGLAAGVLGGVLPIPLPDPLKDRFVIGFGFYTPFDLVVRSRILYATTPQYLLPDSVESIAAIVGLGVHIGTWDGWSLQVGGGFEALAALAGSVLASVDASGQLGAVVQDTLVANYAPIAGVSLDIPGGYRAGFTFRGALEGRFDVRIDIKDLGQITVPPIFVSGMAQYDPLTLEAEFAKVKGPVRGSVGVGYRRWSSYPGLAEATVRCPLDLGRLDIAICGALKPIEPEFNDTVIARASFEAALPLRPGLDLDLRAGYAFESAPGPEQTGETNLFAEARSVVAFGIGSAVFEPLTKGVHLDAFGQVGIIHGRSHDKEASGSGDNFGRTSIQTGGTMVAGGTTAGVAF